MKPFPYNPLNGISYTESKIRKYRESFLNGGAGVLGMFKAVISEITDVSHGMIILELSYPEQVTLGLNDHRNAIQQLFRDPLTPDFWDISFVHIIEYHTTGPGGYMGMCGNIVYDQGRGYIEGESSFKRHYINDQLFDTRAIYEILYEIDIKR